MTYCSFADQFPFGSFFEYYAFTCSRLPDDWFLSSRRGGSSAGIGSSSSSPRAVQLTHPRVPAGTQSTWRTDSHLNLPQFIHKHTDGLPVPVFLEEEFL